MSRRADPLTTEAIVAAAERVIATHGPAKANVVDVARALGVSHGSVYRHFPSKAAIRAEVARRWLDRLDEPLAAVVARGDVPPVDRIRAWIHELSRVKVRLAATDPELFDAYVGMVEESDTIVQDHVRILLAQLAEILAAADAAGQISVGDDPTAAVAADLFRATSRFHDPLSRRRWTGQEAELEQQLDRVLDLLLAGLRR